ncbi:DNA-directed RNA polymerase subunit beta [Metabacillus indicus]|uniref:Hydroxymyristoyl-ACP dehydratase n=1 Tax=Metabacillus indicus TaxID=246786 RepID=A0A084GY01_METID|nr:DNA-directed RNA polymerase subunit beta [Metabacillus indicus]KEZ52213.1 hydroxymyristoyl-ACP dehydratase [Metabacillus indicus]
MSANEQSREHVKQQKKSEEKSRKIRIRLIPIWLRLLFLLISIVIAVICGAMIGYGVLGEGNPADVFDKKTWQHVIDLVEKDS